MSETTTRKLGAYFFRGGMFTLVPHHIREQLDDMRSLGTDIVCLAVNGQDSSYNHMNIEFLVEECHLRGMEVYFVPSRTAGITAGAPLTADTLGYRFPHTWTVDREGKPLVRACGVLCSFYYPEVEEHVFSEVDDMVSRYRPDGIIWDEPKSTNWQDFSAKALENNPEGDFERYLKDFSSFFSRINARLKQAHPDLKLLHFDEACRWDPVVKATAEIEHLDYIGVDGRPWVAPCEDAADNRREQKVLPLYGERYLSAARAQGAKTFALIENQRLDQQELESFERDIERVLEIDADLMLYYYYGFHQADVERNMQVIRDHLPAWRKG